MRRYSQVVAAAVSLRGEGDEMWGKLGMVLLVKQHHRVLATWYRKTRSLYPAAPDIGFPEMSSHKPAGTSRGLGIPGFLSSFGKFRLVVDYSMYTSSCPAARSSTRTD